MANKKTNILFILTDDQGAWALGCSGNKELKTPNIDRLAANGMRFENFFCVSPVCSPARVSLYTGKIPSQHGVHDWLAKGHLDESVLANDLRDAFRDENPEYEYRWPRMQLKGDRAIRYLDNQVTFTQILAENGYECGLSGKWHMGDSFTKQAGFTYWRTTGIGGENYMAPVVLEDNQMVMKKGKYVTDHITENALNFFDARDKDKPFCLSVHFTAPHSPWSEKCHPKEFIAMYDNCPFESIPNDPPHPWCSGVDQTREEWDQKPHDGVRFIHAEYAPIRSEWEEYRRESLRGYFASVTAMDRSVGKILDRLDAEGLTDDTLIVFTSDNGSNMGQHGIFGKGNGTYPMNMYDTSVKVPGIFTCKGRIPAGVVSEEMVSHYDVFETILDFVGINYKIPENLPGKSFSKILTGEKTSLDNRDNGVVVFDEYGPVRMLRTKEWKYVRRYPDGPDELYDLIHDAGEYQNLIENKKYNHIVSAMSDKLDEWFDKFADPQYDGTHEDVRGKGQNSSHNFVK